MNFFKYILIKCGFVFLVFPHFLYSQGEWNNWYFGQHAGITFNFGSPVALNNCASTFDDKDCPATCSDSLGNLLFYADCWKVYNRNHVPMPNGSPLATVWGSHQPLFLVQNLDDDSSYYLFTMDYMQSSGYPNAKGLSYSVIDMRLDGGLGDIVAGQKNIQIPSAAQTAMMLSGTRHHNNHDVWIAVRKYMNSNEILTYLVTSGGINPVPVVSYSLITLPYLAGDDPSMLKFSPDGKKLVCLYDTIGELCDFNSTNGQITPLFTFRTQWYLYEGVSAEFSIDSKYLYIPVDAGSGHARLYQYDATKTDSFQFKLSETFIAQFTASGLRAGLQLGPDWKIYCTYPAIDSLSVINNPTVSGLGCNFQLASIFLLNNNLSKEGLPQFLQKYKAYIYHSGGCFGNPVHFASDIWPPPDTIRWNFGDPGSGGFNVSNLPNPSHIYSFPGTYTVELYVRHNDNRTDTTWKSLTILPSPQPALGPDRTVCTGDSVTFDAGACSGCTYLWKDLGTGLPVGSNQTFKTGLAGTYSVTVTNSGGCIGADTVQLITTAVPSVTNNPLSKTICSEESTNIALTSSVPGTNFHWAANLTSGNITGFSADSGLVINQVLTNSLPTPGVVTYHITPKIGSCVGTTVDFPVTVNPGDSVKVSITATANNICEGTTVIFTANPTNPGTTPVYQWKVNGINSGTNSTTFTYTPLNGDVVTCLLLSSLTVCISNNPATSNGITMIVNPNLPVSVTVSPSQNPVCAGTSVTFTAIPINGGTTPSYQWKVNGINVGTNSPNYTYTPTNGDLVSCTLTSSETCTTNNPATSTQYLVNVNPNLPVSVAISASANPFCLGSSVTFTATPTNGGTTPSYQWKVNGANAGSNSPNFTYNPANGDQVYCILTSSELCTLSNPASSISITMVENTSLPAGVSIAASNNPFCPGSSVTFSATPINGGITPSYQWKVNGINVGTNSSTYSYNPANNDSIRCIMTSNLSCVTGNPASSAEIIMSGTLAPIVTFTSCFDTITTINAKPIKLKGGIPLGGTYSGPGVNSLTGIFTPSLAGVGTHTITYTYTNAAMCTAIAHAHIINYPLSIVNCGNPITDIRDNKIYQTVQIGSQCWLATNLNYGTILASSQDQRDNCVAEKYCYNDNPINCTNYGGLYQWDELMLFDETPADQGFCPPGWHIPTENEWNALFANYINSGFAGSPLKYSGYSGFNALLFGVRHINKAWDYQGIATFFWSSTPLGNTKAWAHGMNDIDPSVSSYPSSRVNAFSVRCLKD